jgi:long-chain acyl-CoA synthetase
VANEPSPRSNLASLVDDFRKHGNQTALVVRSGLRRRSCSYGELARMCGRFARLLADQNVSKGDRVLLWAPNGPEWIAAFFGCILRGVLPVPLDEAGSSGFVKRVEKETAPRLIVTTATHARELDSETPVLTIEEMALRLPQAPDFTAADLSAADPLQIIFTSGTTGEPKGVVHTHGNVLASLLPIEREIGRYLKYERIFHPLRFLHTLPLSHVFGQFMGLWIPPLIAAEIHFEDRLIASDLIERIRGERISVLAAVPRVLDLLREHLRQRYPDLEQRRERARGISAWKRWWRFRDVHKSFGLKFWSLVCGGAALPSDLEQFWNSLGFLVVQGYGMTETTALVSLNHPFRASSGTLGQVLPGREVKLTDEGEVLVRGDTVSQVMWQNGKPQPRESDWLATGDLAELDEKGNLRFRGRKKDVIVTAAGLNIHPDDLEAALLAQPEVKACTVIEAEGLHGPEPMAVLVLRKGDAQTAIERANRSLAEYQRIQRWTVWPEPDLPRTSTGKVLRREVVRALAQGGRAADETKGSLAAVLSRISQGGTADDQTVSEELNLDSLARVELQAGLEEQFGVTVDDAAMQKVRTLADLKAALQQPAQHAPSEDQAERTSRKHIYPTWPWRWIVLAWRVLFLEVVMRGFVYFLAKPRIYRRSSSSLATGPFLIYANHVTAVDVPLILYALPGRLRRRCAVAMSGEILLQWRERRYYRYRFLNWISPLEYIVVTALFNVFPLPQMSGFRKSFAHAARAMDRRYSVIVFPEGRRATDEKVQPFMSGSGLLWTDLRCQALPVYLGGLGELKRTNERWFRSGKLSVTVGEPMALPPNIKPEEATELMEREIRKLELSRRGERAV